MSDNPNIGRKVKSIFWTDISNEACPRLNANSGGTGELVLLREGHGSYDVDWIVELKDGREVARYNAIFVESIHWAEEPSDV